MHVSLKGDLTRENRAKKSKARRTFNVIGMYKGSIKISALEQERSRRLGTGEGEGKVTKEKEEMVRDEITNFQRPQ